MNEPDRRVGGRGGGVGRRPGSGAPAVPRVRLVDVAREAGLSKTTVSAALNGTGRLSDAVRAHARETARRLGYRPNATARLLRAGHARLIGFAVREYVAAPWVYMESPYFTQLTNATARAAMEHGHALVLLPNHSGRDEWADLPLDAVCINDPIIDDPLVDDFLAAGIPVVSDRRVDGQPGGYWVDMDHDLAIRGVLDHLADNGATDIVTLAAGSDTLFTVRSLEVQAQWAAERGVRTRVEVVEKPGYGHTLASVEKVLGDDDRPDALFILTETSPLLVIDAARRAGYRVPDDLLIVCVSEDGIAEHTDPGMTTLSLQPEELALAAMELLVEALSGAAQDSRGIVVPTKLHIRGSTVRKSG
ncbi:LacI family DNA-binding transcriptional regulator [Yinghuangia seranimata]|uniref:LacI family DNA-binding transcriptional regulator n=1 Tax=Yinghuangia seranimata TaxID=408067 RepID=UPI00248CF8CA|nr:LacI family DNA-binding transcriptional regulator [Yinghuangia seranimata]MDI2129755.1 LacI family DNA-binding transcriptional regulator [Yinghuangia seranimata]